MSSLATIEKTFRDMQYFESGGISHLYHAYDRATGQQVVLKTLKHDFCLDQERRAQFRREAMLQSRVRAPSVIQVLDYLETDDRQWIVLEYGGPETLWKYLKNRPSPLDSMNGKICGDVCASLAAVHQAGIIHNDMKTLNFLMGTDQQLRLTDFGEAITADSDPESIDHEALWGSPLYTAPEVSAGALPRMTSDVYSAGIILYQVLTGELPFRGENPGELARLHQTKAPYSLRAHNPQVPQIFETIVLRALQKDPSERYPDGISLSAAIGRAAHDCC